MSLDTLQELNIEVPRTARYAQLGALGTDTRAVWFVCHGYGLLARIFIKKFERLVADGHTVVVAPEALSRSYMGMDFTRVGACWTTREERDNEVHDQKRYLDLLHDHILAQLPNPAAVQVNVLGFSQGVSVAWRWVNHGHVRPHNMVLWAGMITDENAGVNALPDLSIHAAFGDQDEYLTPERIQEFETLASAVRHPIHLHRYIGGHSVDQDVLDAIRPLLAALPLNQPT